MLQLCRYLSYYITAWQGASSLTNLRKCNALHTSTSTLTFFTLRNSFTRTLIQTTCLASASAHLTVLVHVSMCFMCVTSHLHTFDLLVFWVHVRREYQNVFQVEKNVQKYFVQSCCLIKLMWESAMLIRH